MTFPDMDVRLRRVAVAITVLALSACGNYGDPGEGDGPGSGSSGGDTTIKDCDALFTKRVQPRLDFCRNCHVPDGIADVADGRLFQLSTNEGEDAAKLRASWEALGGNADGKSRILKMASGTDTRSHTGGIPWPEGSDAYREMDAYLRGYDDPAACDLGDVGGGIEERALIGPPRGGGAWSNFCEGQPDSATLPTDPRTLVVPGVNEGKAVAFNAYWKDCDNAVARPRTCGEMRTQAALGYFVGHGQGEVGTPVSFAGGNENPSGLPAADYNELWRTAWGLSARPDNFDDLVAERYGSPKSLGRNPYPLPGEDPNATDGGSGQLPMAFTQIREADGTWTGEIGQKVCIYCHNGQLGTPDDGPGLGPQLGGAGSIGDFQVTARDFGKAGGFDPTAATSLITLSTNRGTGAIDFFQLAFILFSNGDPTLLLNPKIVFSQAIGNIKSPPWWNLAYRPQKFHGAVLPTDSSRIDLAAYYDIPRSLTGGAEETLGWMDAHAGPFQVWAETLSSPRFPGAIDTALAEQGAILFHSKNLWDENLDNPSPRPDAGNGSCAGCHGVYSPRYAHDTAYLDTPELAGLAAYTVPTSVIGTDPVYAEAMQSLRNADGSTSPAIARQAVLYCGTGNAGHTPDRTPILLTPPLWGIWAAAPYFHNGSVPNIWGVLDPEQERPNIWKRHSTPARADQAGQVVMGYDTNLQRAYDFDKLGWKYDEIPCGTVGTQPYLACDPARPDEPSPVQHILGSIYTLVGLTWNLPRPESISMSRQDIENRKIYNTNLYSQGNEGHAFTSVLTDQERRAIIEYLKTL
ncbi:MAG TPA: hypothetical protein VJM11_00135 [Nevskiaceae bacterium]|nr:hypothetical protein [Nevskiaceae bacterium]